eukprot:TRINITY_DN3411_c1_g1_i2.p1 TRINITY_DN3411_c1_g1~~TRINITY_DN3411_c1_g1_i2.p1  ORF type:complete len:514 (+),score=68.45 TRINITY_DN3411_c1_g1_i2:819-2360(+)
MSDSDQIEDHQKLIPLEIDQVQIDTNNDENSNSKSDEENYALSEDVEKFSDEETRVLFRRVTYNIIPTLFCMIVFCYVDRTNLSFASLSMFEDLSLSCSIYGLGSGIFFLAYGMFQVPSNLVLVRVGAPLWLGIIVFGWGIIAASFSAIKTATQFVVIRFVLGIFEAGAFPGMWYYLTLFYPKDRLSLPFAIVEAGIAFSQVIGAPLASALLALDGVGGLQGWQWVFIVEGISTIIIGIVIWIKLPKDVQHSKFLDQGQKQWLSQQLRQQQISKRLSDLNVVLSALKNFKVWHMSAVMFMRSLAQFGVMFWLPILTYSMIHEDDDEGGVGKKCGSSETDHHEDNSKKVMTVLLTSVPYFLATAAMLINGYHIQKTYENRLHGAIPFIIGGVSFLFFSVFKSISKVLGFIVLTITVVGIHAPSSVLLNLVCAHADSEILHVALPLFNAVGQIGSFLGPFVTGLFLDSTGSYTPATIFVGVMLACGGVLLLLINDPIYQRHRQNIVLNKRINDSF